MAWYWDVAKGILKGAATGVAYMIPGVGVVTTAYMAYETGEAIGKISVRKMHVANDYGDTISVIVTPNRDWVWADVGAAVAQLAISVGSSAPSGLAGLKAAKTMWEVYSATRVYRGVYGVGKTLWGFFENKGFKILPGTFSCVNERTNSNPLNYLTPSQYGALLKAKDFSVTILAMDGQAVMFNSNSDTSWVVDKAGAHPVVYGKLWVKDASKPMHAWNS
jgi:hypothetical protein